MSVWKARNKWYYKFRHQSQAIISKRGYSTRNEAKLAEAEKRISLAKMPATRMGFAQLSESRLKDLEQKRDHWYFCDNKALILRLSRDEGWGLKNTITRDDITNFLDKILKETSPQRANKYLAYLKALFNHGLKKGFVEINPAWNIEKYPEDRRLKYVPPEKDVIDVLFLCTPEQRDYLWTLALTAARCGEINSLTVANVNLDLGHITISTRKTKGSQVRYRRINIGSTLREILARRIAEAVQCRSEYVFFNKRTGKPFNYRSKFLKNICRKAKVFEFTFHSLRHFAALAMDREGVPLTDIQAILGHGRATTTDIYLSSVQAVRPLATDALENKLRDKYIETVTKGKQSKVANKVASAETGDL